MAIYVEIADGEVLRVIRKDESAMAPVFGVALWWRVDEVDVVAWGEVWLVVVSGEGR